MPQADRLAQHSTQLIAAWSDPDAAPAELDLLVLIHECGSNERELLDPLPMGALGCELPGRCGGH